MTLREDQIIRYGRQILLREVGGKGQQRLLDAAVRVQGAGPALDDAVAYLLAGGSPVARPPGVETGGFLAGALLEALNPDAAPRTEPLVELVPVGTSSEAPAQVIVGAGVASRRADACDGCWQATRSRLPAGEAPGAGSLAALAVQRLVLGWADPLSLVVWSGQRYETLSPGRCGAHQAPPTS